MSRNSLILLLLFIGFVSSLQAQKRFSDSLFVFNSPLEITAPGDVPGFTAPGDIAGITSPGDIPLTLVTLPGLGKLKPISLSVAKTQKLPQATRVSRTPITLKSGGKCYVFGCANLKTCSLVWFDRNNDGKVQPRKELRCVDARGNLCQMVVKQVKCK